MISKPAWIAAGRAERLALVLSLALCVAVCCISCITVSRFYLTYHIAYNPALVSSAALAVAVFAPAFLLFVFAEFSFGYLVGFYLSAVLLGFLWLSFFSNRSYDHEAARVSAAVSGILFLLPVLFVTSPLPRPWRMSTLSFDRLTMVLLLACLAIIALGAMHNFNIVYPGDASNLRTASFPPFVRYLLAMSSSAVLPFLFAYSIERRRPWHAGGILLAMLLFYPIVTTKTAFFAPAWLVLMWLLSRLFGARLAVVLSLLLPIAAGLVINFWVGGEVLPGPFSFFFNANFRLTAVPSLALDLYNEFFSTHDLTHFCQIGVIGRTFGCPYRDQLAVVMLNYFPAGGTYNGSLFATEGIASVGRTLAPVSAFVCGLIVAAGNRASARLPDSFILTSGAILAQIFFNTPLSITLVTHGGVLLFLLWYLVPREVFEQPPGNTADCNRPVPG